MSTERKIGVDELKPGMYVKRLDRPWLESPFPFQGFEVNDWDDVRQVREVCEHVYIETDPVELAKNKPAPAADEPPKRLGDFLKRAAPQPPPHRSRLREELAHAIPLIRDSRKLTDQIMNDAKMGRSVDTSAARESVEALTESVLRNPYALLWLAQLKGVDEYTYYHSLSVCVLALSVGRHLGLPREQLRELGFGAFLHDIGKMRIDEKILNKPDTLDEGEQELMRLHPEYGAEIAEGTERIPSASRDIIYSHHERLDGSGYVDGREGEQIAPLTHLVAICDTYDAVTSNRPYKTAVSPGRAVSILNSGRNQMFDSALVERFIQCVGVYSVGSLVELTSGEIGVVTGINPKARLRPRVLVLVGPDGKRLDRPWALDLSRTGQDAQGQRLDVVRSLASGAHDIDTARIASRLGQS